MRKSQKSIFLEYEGDGWFNRNREALIKQEISKPLLFYRNYLQAGFRILEIGCADGYNLNHLQSMVECECYGVDPSKQAIEEGRKQYPSINLLVGTADNLEFADCFFDFILFGFCLYLTDRNLLTKIVAEADRVLKNKGYIGITDFDSKFPKQRTYKHFNGVLSYKMDYASLFLAFPHFSMADKYCFSHAEDHFVKDVKERVCSCVLYKDMDNAYFDEED